MACTTVRTLVTTQGRGEPVRSAIQILRRGGVIAAPTETLIGLLADAHSKAAVEAVLAIKRRSGEETLGLIAPDLESVASLALPLEGKARELAERHWPGPLTLVLDAKPGLHPALIRDGAVAIRIPAASPALDLCRAFGGPLTATSANLRGGPSVASTEALDPAILQAVDGILEGKSPGGAPSTIARVRGDRIEVLREGAIAAEALTSGSSPR